MRYDVISIFPEYLAPLELSLLGKARDNGLVQLHLHNLRDFTSDKHRTVDDTPYGGGAGMVMKPEPWGLALDAVLEQAAAERAAQEAPDAPALSESSAVPARDGRPLLVVPSPAGAVFDQAMAYDMATEEHIVFAPARYEGIDERVFEWAAGPFRVMPVSLGDYVLYGGEVAVMAMIEAITRLIPGAMGNPLSLEEESHTGGLLEYPVYTKPAVWRDLEAPAVLLSGNHGAVDRWRRDRQIERTLERRRDMFDAYPVELWDKKDRRFLAERGIHFHKPKKD
ncbi:MAG: tRNA (guanosine(37)-N1)-methyltransferase TrmD [Rothia sp. (in: high G+C Gram-positive bacteria)]|uniref:tRNA (guanosine(37)-N1)-methyltransferase TrmD n=1 Tax=Rothia sp. (in: high G+C Gram-positive bacteria) TaxID=1885016 RepID=UPI0026DF1272|nr:tRNA (guanosine(37)-N1)-methyltransferase TrmD [Rothia sp. (in: high G+C Gram-positive bacteria)]MDO5750923.1 tRNA (guanosine(37)-N1)-methyltransferase TrmD [Rothia sp. (in: high G+C Gram-positive bacteria)]